MLSSCLERKAHLERKAESIKLKAKLFGLGNNSVSESISVVRRMF